MTLLEDAPSSSSRRAELGEVELLQGLLPTAVFGTSAGVSLHANLRYHVFGLTTVPAAEPRPSALRSEEVCRLRDEICHRGLTRQDVARAMGVDRRSLSGYASGEINPQPERLQALRMLSRVSRDIEAQRPSGVREVLLAQHRQDTLIDAIASGRYGVAAAWPTWLARLEARTDVRARSTVSDPIWAPAMQALADGRLPAPAWAGTVRSAETYEMDVTEAGVFQEESAPDRRRRGYQ